MRITVHNGTREVSCNDFEDYCDIKNWFYHEAQTPWVAVTDDYCLEIQVQPETKYIIKTPNQTWQCGADDAVEIIRITIDEYDPDNQKQIQCVIFEVDINSKPTRSF